MTTLALKHYPVGLLETRSFTLKVNDCEYEKHYSLVKGKNGKYFIGFSDDGSYCSSTVSEEVMVHLINNKIIQTVKQ